MTEVYEFAKDAVDLPNDPASYAQNTAYKSKPNTQLINNGFGTQIYVDSATLNYYLNKLTSFIKTFKTYGIVHEKAYNDIFTPDEHREGDIYLKGDDFRLYYFKDGKERMLEERATFQDTGLITRAFNHSDPWKLLPEASYTTEGYYSYARVIKKKFNSEKYSRLETKNPDSFSKGHHIYQGCFAESYFSAQEGEPINLFMNWYGEDSKDCRFQKVYLNDARLIITIEASQFCFQSAEGESCEDFYILENGTVCY